MNMPSPYDSQLRWAPWVICQPDQRWTDAVARFGQAMMPGELVPAIDSVDLMGISGVLSDLLRRSRPSMLIWRIQSSRFLPMMDQIMHVADAQASDGNGRILQWVAGQPLSRPQRLALTELGIVAFLNHPEDLVRYEALVRAHFEKWASSLD